MEFLRIMVGMDILHTFFTVLAFIAVFLFAIKKFSHQVEILAGDKFKASVRKLTSNPFKGTIIGAAVTALLQSSTATTVMAVGFVNAGVMSFYNSLGIIFGANIGTAINVQLFALNLSTYAPYILVAGFLMTLAETPLKKYSKLILYFGLMFFCLSYIGQIVEPLQKDPIIAQFFTLLSTGYNALWVGLVFAVLFQSSTVTSGIAVILASKGIIGLSEAIYIIFGANIGTTSTAILSSVYLDRTAKKTAVAHLLFNVLGVVMMLPLIGPFLVMVEFIGGTVTQQIINANIIFNLLSTLVALIFVHQFASLVDLLTPNEKSKLATAKVLIKD